MSRLIAYILVGLGAWWIWRRFIAPQSPPPSQQGSAQNPSQRLQACVRCDAMLPTDPSQRKEIARSCSHSDRCPLHSE